MEVTIPYRGQLFFPRFSPINLKAVAYAKAFGASFGSSQQDNLVPRNGSSSFPNYSVKDPDPFGLTHEHVQRAWSFLFTNGTAGSNGNQIRNTSESQGRTFNNYSSLPENVFLYKDPTVVPYRRVGSTSTTVNVELVQNEIFTKQMRVYEEMAIAPDQFDLKYYTILPNYMLTLYPKLKKVFSGPNEYVPADLGHFRNLNPTISIPQSDVYYSNTVSQPSGRRNHNPIFRLNYIERQIIYANKVPAVGIFNALGLFHIFRSYKARGVNDLLTSWAPNKDSGMYNSPTLEECDVTDEGVKLTFNASSDPFLNTTNSDPQHRKILPSHCLKGGRTGFSVKLIDPSAL